MNLRDPRITARLAALLTGTLLVAAGPAFAAGMPAGQVDPQLVAGSVQPNAVPSLPPAEQATQLRYPAYGPAMAGVVDTRALPNVPAKLNLSAAVLIAVATSPTLAAARADVGIAQAEVRLARTGLLPSLAGDVTSNHIWQGGGRGSTITQNGQNGAVVTSSTNPSTNYQSNAASLSLSQLIFDGGRTAAGIRAAQASETSAADTYRRALQTLAYNVATAYYGALSAERTTQVDIELVRENQQQESLVSAQFRAGTAARVDVTTAELPVAQAQVAVIQAQGNQVAQLAAFANALGLPADADVQPQDDVPVIGGKLTSAIPALGGPLQFVPAIARAVMLRPDLAASEASIKAAKFSLKQASLGLFPSLTGNASTGLTSTSIGGGVYGHSSTVGAELAVPLFDRGTTSAETAQARANLDVAQANYESTMLGVSLNVRQTLAQLVSAQAALRASVVALNEGTVVLQSTQAQYRAGVTTLPQLLNSQVGLSQALISEVNAFYTLRQAQQSYYYALGEDVVAMAAPAVRTAAVAASRAPRARKSRHK